MGRDTFTEHDFAKATAEKGIVFTERGDGSLRAECDVSRNAKEEAFSSHKLHPSVDPAVMVVRRSLPRFEQLDDGTYRMTVGMPIDIEDSCDTTGSMGDNVQRRMEGLVNMYEAVSEVLPGCDPQLALGIFGDRHDIGGHPDRFPLQRPQFEMTASKIVDYVAHLVPEGGGADSPEDPQYAIFAAAYLTDTFTNRCGLKGYHFLITDAAFHDILDPSVIEELFGKNVWNELAENGHPEIKRNSLPTFNELFAALHRRAHAFLISVGRSHDSLGNFNNYYDFEHRIRISDTTCLPAVEAAVVGLTEGTLQPLDVKKFLEDHQVSSFNIYDALPGLMKVPFCAQRKLERESKVLTGPLPKKGDIFARKTDVNPIRRAEDMPVDVEVLSIDDDRNEDSGDWL